jgi:formate hydrogenlyase transcriptional activator
MGSPGIAFPDVQSFVSMSFANENLSKQQAFEGIVGCSTVLMETLNLVRTVAPTDSTVLIEGETGTGKEVIASAIHACSKRRDRAFIKLNCTAIPVGLLESELFGHEKGAFTGAVARKIGRFEAAHGGTLFLDEIGDIPLELQPKLLRVLQEGEFERLGSTQTQRVNVRLVAATNGDLGKLISEKLFRSDLYYRLNVFPISVPPLRDRAEDIPLLVRYFVTKFATRMQKVIERIRLEVMASLTSYSWPGNIRELQNFIECSVILTHGTTLRCPLDRLRSGAIIQSSPQEPITLEDLNREHICKTLQQTRGVIMGPNGAAARLGIKRTTLYARMRKLGISRSNKTS